MVAQVAPRNVVRDRLPLGLHLSGSPPRSSKPDSHAVACRTHLGKLLEEAKLTPPQAAKQAGISPATIYNFFAGDSNKLSNETVYKLALVLADLDINLMLALPPGTPPVQIPGAKTSDRDGEAIPPSLAEDLAAVPAASVVPTPGTGRYRARQMVELRMEARAGRYLASRNIEGVKPIVGMPLTPAISSQAVFGVRVGGEGDFYPRGTLLAVVPLTGNLDQLVPGRLVLVTRTRRSRTRNAGGRVEISLRLLRQRGNRLVLSLTQTGMQESVEEVMPAAFTGEAWVSGTINVRIVGLAELVCAYLGPPEIEKAPPG